MNKLPICQANKIKHLTRPTAPPPQPFGLVCSGMIECGRRQEKIPEEFIFRPNPTPTTIIKIKNFILIIAFLCFTAVAQAATPSRNYYEQANEPRFDEIHLGMTIAEVSEICGGHRYLPFETTRGTFAFAVDGKRSGILSLPWDIDLQQTVDFFSSSKRVLVVFYKDEKVHGLMVFNFANERWENRSKPATKPDDQKPDQEKQ